MIKGFKTSWHEHHDQWILMICLMVGFIHGVIYTFLVLPWQHYDEPNHFEYAWLMAHYPGKPDVTSNDPQLNRQVVQSMIRNGFYDITHLPIPDIHDPNLRMPYYSQKGDPPLYYFVASIPLRFMGDKPIEEQLMVVRLVSVGFFLLTIFFAWGFTRELTTHHHPLRWMVPVSIVLLPSLVDIHAAANNDSAGIAMFSLFLWGSVRWLKQRSWLNLIWVINSTITCLITRNTTFVALPLMILVIPIGLTSRQWRKWIWAGVFCLFVIVGVMAIRWGEPLYWYHKTSVDQNASLESSQAIDGKRVFALTTQAGQQPPQLTQILSTEDTAHASYDELTMAGWIWADQPVHIQTPKLHLRSTGSEYVGELDVTTRPTFFTLRIKPDGNLNRGWITFALKPDDAQSLQVYLDQLILVKGQFNTGSIPVVDDATNTVNWNGVAVKNLVRNGSAEKTTVAPRYWIERFASKVLPDKGFNSISLTIYTLMDFAATGKYYQGVALQIFRTFWARFGWGGLSLVGGTPYRYILILCLLAVVGFIFFILKNTQWQKIELYSWILLIGGILLFLAFTRGSNFILAEHDYYPNARYIYPVVIGILFLLNLGWYTWIERLMNWGKIPYVVMVLVYIGLWLYLDWRSVQALWLFRQSVLS